MDYFFEQESQRKEVVQLHIINKLQEYGFSFIFNTQKTFFFGISGLVIKSKILEEKMNQAKTKMKENEIIENIYDVTNKLISSEETYKAYIFDRDLIDCDEKLKNYFLDIISFLTKNYFSDNCISLKLFFQDELNYFLLLENIDKYKFPEIMNDPDTIRELLLQLNKFFEIKHNSNLYDHLIGSKGFNLKYLDEEKKQFRIIMNMEAFIEQLKFRYSMINHEIIKGKIKEYKSLDPEIKKKLIERKELSTIYCWI